MEAAGQKMLKNLFQSSVWNVESAKCAKLYTDENKSKYSSNPQDICNLKKQKKSKQKTKNYETLYIKETASKALSCYYWISSQNS